MTDITLLTCRAYYKPDNVTPYIQNILLEQELLKSAFEAQGLKVDIAYWDNPTYEWQETKSVFFRTIWDYFERFDEFWEWLEQVKTKTRLINSYELIKWNIDKHYLKDLSSWGIETVPTYFADKGCNMKLHEIAKRNQWKDLVIKPAISASAFKTYKILANEIQANEKLFNSLVQERNMLVQPYFETITQLGEASLMVFDGKFTHAILKKAQPGDFRVQDDFGGTVHNYIPTKAEINFAEKVFETCKTKPVYGRVDIVWDNDKNFYLSELEIIEPELWIRNYPKCAERIAEAVDKIL
jgi:glutathione synthase/RimK-type ligase-like ATP-grasp enzyme